MELGLGWIEELPEREREQLKGATDVTVLSL